MKKLKVVFAVAMILIVVLAMFGVILKAKDNSATAKISADGTTNADGTDGTTTSSEFPVGTYVVPMDEKQTALKPGDVTVFGFIWAILNDGANIYRIIEPPDVTLKTTTNPGGTVYSGGVILVMEAHGAIITAQEANFPTVVVDTLMEAFTSNNVLAVTKPTKILVIYGVFGHTDETLSWMKIPYTMKYTTDVEANPAMLLDYDLVVDDCPGWLGSVPDAVVTKMKTLVSNGGELIFTDIALADLAQVFPGYVSVVENLDWTGDVSIHNPPLTGFAAEYPSQYSATFPSTIKLYTMGAGRIVDSLLKPAEVRVIMDSSVYDSAYRILACYFPYGPGLVEGFAYHPQEQTEDITGDLNSYVVSATLYGNKFITAVRPPVAKYDLTVQVKDASTKNPIEGAKVDVAGPESRSASTNSTGYVDFLDLSTGDYTVTASASGYQSGSASVKLDADKQIQIELTPKTVASAIDKGLTWLAAQQNPTDGSWGDSYRVGQTGLAVLKFETHALQQGKDPLDPSYTYYTNVRKGLDYIFSMAYNIAIEMQPAGNPDTNGNGIGVYIYEAAGERMYETGIAAMAIAHSKHPEMVVNVPGSDVDGRTYKDVLTDVVDYIAFGQNDAWVEWGEDYLGYRGGWQYQENPSVSDNSVSGYAVLGLVYAESPPPIGFGLTIPAFVKTELNYWIDYIQTDVTGGTDDGGSGYVDPGNWVNILKTGNLLQEMAFVGDTLATKRVQDAIDYIERHWDDPNRDPGWRGDGTTAHKQAMFAAMKGLAAFGISTITVQRGDPAVPTVVDWFDEMATVLLAQQNPDGSWPDDYWVSNPIASTWALLVLEKAAPPVAKYDLTVQVKDAVSLDPISGATVTVTGPESRTGSTGAAGDVLFGKLLVGDYTVTASATGYESNSASLKLDKDTTIEIKLTPKPGTLNGTVTDALTTLPIEGAAVSAGGKSATTDALGRYEITLDRGTYDVTAGKTGYVTKTVTGVVILSEKTTTQNFALTPMYRLTVHVKDSVTGASIAGATVDVAGPESRSGSTDSTGYAVFLDLIAGDYTATASAAGYQSASATVTLNQDKEIEMELTLIPTTGIISGTVTDASTGLPIEGATVTANGVSTSTNAEGRYQITIAPGTYTVTAGKSGYVSASKPATVTVGVTTTVDFALTPIPPPPMPGTLDGTVTDALTTMAIEGATVSAGGKSATTDASGHYQITLDPGTYDVTADKTGYVTETVTGVVIVSQATTTQNIALTPVPPPLYDLTVHVKDSSTKNPIAGAKVDVTGQESRFTNGTGYAVFLDLITGDYTATASATDYESASATVTLDADKQIQIELIRVIEIIPVYNLTVHVKDSVTKASLAGVKVDVAGPETRSDSTNSTGYVDFLDLLTGDYTATASAAGYRSASATVTLDSNKQVEIELTPVYNLTVHVKDSVTKNPIEGSTLGVSGPESRSGSTNGTGYAVFLNLITGDYSVAASATGYKSSSATVTLDADKLVEIELTPLYDLTVHVKDSVTGASIAGAKVDVTGPETRSDFTNSTGYAVFLDLLAGDYSIAVSAAGYQSKTASVKLDADKQIEIELTPIYDLTVHVKDAVSKNPIAGASVAVTGPEARSDFTNSTGFAVFLDLLSGDYTATASAAAYKSATASVTLDADKQVQIELTPVYNLTVRVKDARTKNPIAGAKVDVSGPESRSAFTNSTGYAVFLNLLKGDYTLTVSAAGYRSASTTVNLDPPSDGLIEIELPPSAIEVEIELEPTAATIESCDSTGATKNSFDVSETVYVTGSGYSLSTAYDIYVVNDVITWSDGMSIPSRVAGTITTVISDASGNIPPTDVWHTPLTLGKYDIVVDVDGNGKYDAAIDALDDMDIQVTAGFFVIPEYPLGTILSLAAIFGAFGAYGVFKRKHL